MQNANEQINQLKKLNEELENYFANTIIPQLFVDAKLILKRYTPSTAKLFNLEAASIGKPIEKIKGNLKYPNIVENIKVAIATGKMLEKEIQTTDLNWYQMNIVPHFSSNENEVVGVIITFFEITARVKSLQEQERLLAEHELLLDTITHDIKTPLLALSLTIKQLKKFPKKSEEELVLQLEDLEISLNNIKEFVEDLINTRWQGQRYQDGEEFIDVPNIVEDVKLTLARQFFETGAQLTEQFEITEIKFVRRKLRSIIYNLLNNAIKYTPASRTPEITISTYLQDNFVVISVADNGIGINNSDRTRIFEKFRRAHTDTSGSGVGLYLVYNIVTAEGGKIALESEVGKGSTFKIFLKHDKDYPIDN